MVRPISGTINNIRLSRPAAVRPKPGCPVSVDPPMASIEKPTLSMMKTIA